MGYRHILLPASMLMEDMPGQPEDCGWRWENRRLRWLVPEDCRMCSRGADLLVAAVVNTACTDWLLAVEKKSGLEPVAFPQKERVALDHEEDSAVGQKVVDLHQMGLLHRKCRRELECLPIFGKQETRWAEDVVGTGVADAVVDLPSRQNDSYLYIHQPDISP